MAFRPLLAALVASAMPAAALGHAPAADEFGPSARVAAQRGPQIFNSVYDSLQKWGAVVHPNGMSLFLATVPEGVMLHHGNNRNETPTELQWLAYEIEHAEMFARGGRRGPPGGPPGGTPGEPGKPPGFEFEEDDDEREDLKRRGLAQAPLEDEPVDTERGWLHTYRTTKPLRFLYLDGMSGNKYSSGVLDTQDILLRGVRSVDTKPPTWGFPKEPKMNGPPNERARALELCEICEDWGLHGVIRTESPGSEIIKCNFFDGLEEVQSVQRSGNGNRPPHGGPPHGGPGQPGGPPGGPGGPKGPGGPGGWPGRRSEADRIREIGSDRTLLDYSSMVSAFFFPVDLTNPDKDDVNFPRLLNTTKSEMAAVKDYLAQVVQERYDVSIARFTWRDVADLIVRRYAPRLNTMETQANKTEDMVQQIRFLLEVFIDYSVEEEGVRNTEAEERCSTFYFQTMPLNTDADRMIYAAFKAVNAEICGALFKARELVLDEEADDDSLEAAKSIVTSLKKYLSWSVFE